MRRLIFFTTIIFSVHLLFAQEPVKVSVDGTKTGDYLYPFWSGLTFHPTEYLSTQWGKNLLTELAESNSIQTYVRIYNQPEFASRVNEDGSISYNWQHFDERVETILDLGLKPLVVFYSMPKEISADPETKNRTREMGSVLYIGPPKDYQLWEEVCADFTRHIVGKYGQEEVESWYFRCWNEPNHLGFWHGKDMEEYFKLYDHFAHAVKSVHPKLKIGGPAVTSTDTYKDPFFYRSFLEHVSEGKNNATGERGAPIDYIAVHTYGGSSGHGGPGYEHPSIKYMFELQQKLADIRDEFEPLKGMPILVEEWGIASGGTKGMGAEPMTATRNSHYGAAFLASLAAQHIERIQDGNDHNIQHFLFCASGYEGKRPRNFNGYRTFTTRDDIHKPIFNGYKLLGKLGDQLVDVKVDQKTDNVFTIATRKPDGSLAIMVTHFDEIDVFNNGEPVSLQMMVNNQWDQEQITIRHWRIDENYSNAFTLFLKMGSPEYLNPLQLETLKKEMVLEKFSRDQLIKAENGIDLNFMLPVSGVSLVEITPGVPE